MEKVSTKYYFSDHFVTLFHWYCYSSSRFLFFSVSPVSAFLPFPISPVALCMVFRFWSAVLLLFRFSRSLLYLSYYGCLLLHLFSNCSYDNCSFLPILLQSFQQLAFPLIFVLSCGISIGLCFYVQIVLDTDYYFSTSIFCSRLLFLHINRHLYRHSSLFFLYHFTFLLHSLLIFLHFFVSSFLSRLFHPLSSLPPVLIICFYSPPRSFFLF